MTLVRALAVVAACQALLDVPGHVTRAELAGALATAPAAPEHLPLVRDPISEMVEDTV